MNAQHATPWPPGPMGTANANLDLLRAVAVLCVFFSHVFTVVTRRPTELTHHIGQLGVIMFFVHTSLVLMGSLERSRLWGWPRVVEFLVQRAFRIYPLAIFCVLIAALVPDIGWTMRQLIANLTLTQNLLYEESMVGGLWTLPLEVQMYLALPFLFMAFRTKPVWWMLAAWLVALAIAGLQPFVSGRLIVLGYVPCFLPGLIAWKLGRRDVLPGWLWPVALCVATVPWLTSAGNHMGPRWITCVLLGLAIPWFRETTSAWLNTASHTIAKYSYGIYLTHCAALVVAFRWLDVLPFGAQVAAFTVMAVGLPYFAFHLVEQPMITYGKQAGTHAATALAGWLAQRRVGVST